MGLFSKLTKSRSNGPVRPCPKFFADWEVPSTFTIVADPMEFQAEFEALFVGYDLDNINGAEFDDWAYLVRECNNLDDYAAVCIWVQGHFIGRLDQATAGEYVVEMNGLNPQGLNLVAPAHLWVQCTKTRLANRVTLNLPPVGAVGLVNFLPERAFTTLSPGDEIVLEDFENYVEPLRPLISTGKTVPVTLVMIEKQSNLYAYLDKKIYVGRVPGTQAKPIIPLVRAVVPRRLIPVARSLLTGSNTRNNLLIVTGNTRTVGTSWVSIHDGGR